MLPEYHRYFIELQTYSVKPTSGVDALRTRETQLRREQAADFIATLNDWLKEKELEDKVTGMAITALGQVQITCEADLISQIHAQEEDTIATIRPAAAYVEAMGKWAR